MKVFGASVIKRHPALAQLLKLAFSDLVSHRCMKPDFIIDVLTLMDEIPQDELGVSDPPSDLCGREFALALAVLKAAPQPTSTVNRLVWKRCLLRDDWEGLSKTSDKSDEEMDVSLMQTAAFLTVKQGIATELFASDSDPAIPSPHSLLGAGSSAEEYDLRFPSEDLRLPIAADNALDDQELKNYIDNCSLGDFFTRVRTLAMEAAAREADEELDRGKREEEFAKAWTEPVREGRAGILDIVDGEVDEEFSADGESAMDVDASGGSMDVDESEEAAIRF